MPAHPHDHVPLSEHEPHPDVEAYAGLPGRRGVLTGAAALAAAGLAAPAFADDEDDLDLDRRGKRPHKVRVTVLGSTDSHGNVFNWDYFKNKEYDDTAHNDIGLAKVATLVKAMRKKYRKRGPVLLLDAGDTIQGTPLAYYYARVAPITAGGTHPMAAAMNQMKYDAAALGNHEFNYGMDTLRAYQGQLDFPLLGANAVDPSTKLPVFPPYTIKKYKLGGGRKLKVGILGLVTPGVAIWDKANVQGKVEFPGLVEQAAKYVPELKKKGCDLVIVSAHSGADTSSSYGDALPYPENAASLVAEQVPDIDAILVGHAHKEIPERFVTNAKTGKKVLLCEPYYWGMRLAVMNLTVEWKARKKEWKLVRSASHLLNSNTAKENLKVAAVVRAQHDKVVTYVNAPIGTSTKLLSAERSVVEDVPIIDFVQYVQAGAVKAALTGADATLPVLSEAAPFSRTASFPQGQVSVRDVAGLYIYDNTLLGVKVTGKDVKDYLEFSAAYFKKQTTAGPYTIAQLTNATTASAPNGIPDYNFDAIRGLDKHLTYKIDVGKDVGSRILDLSYDGAPVDPAAQFVLAVNNYRQSGGGGFPAVKTAPVVYNAQVEIRQLLIDWVTTNKVIDVDTPPTQFTADWKLVYNGADVTIS
ncbi:bifunctional metallophosphatase/5'-nucleotidase [Nocardioides anomalus]|uniref:Bifunctional metallophosphatase/5'-nucleotidase n=1 Tax=Nocardioides anomalus TaxID=2712223 RepID=A0A6G6W9W6_9ACTN|nr:5'-nucleotidase C-terminal domain-containing protein [Nocardioides anomalus]QIG41947.1 bifunctional metallophosphatase/5'-nucleotidase [Nocardioides anomalus]